MRTETLLRGALMMLIVALAVVITSWVGSEDNAARADSGGVGGNWILVTSTIQSGESLLYMFDTQRQTLLVYAFYRRAGISRGTSRYRGDLEFLAGRHCKWDALYSQKRPYPYGITRKAPPSGAHMPKAIKDHLTALDAQ
jgi:hypothetical protein